MKQKFLKKCPLFVTIEEQDIEPMLDCLCAATKQFKKGSFILSAGEKSTQFGILTTGRANIIQEDFWGNRTILSNLLPGDLFGEAFACANTGVLPVTVMAQENCEVLFIDSAKIIATCASACVFHSKLIRNMLTILANKNILLTQKMEHLSKRSTKEKLLSYLSAQAIKANSNTFHIPFNRQELADYLCVERSAMSAALSKMKADGIVDYYKNSFKLLH